jgi:hypothetical protein
MAFEAISDAGNAAPLLLRELAPAVTDMVSGQVLDTLSGGESKSTSTPLQRLEAIHRGKTGALIRAACRMGVICAARPGLYNPTRDETAMPAITAYADALGLMFQIVDDLLDVEQSTAQLGKTAGKDAAAGKLTYPGVIGVEASRVEVARQLDACLKALAPLGAHATPLADFLDDSEISAFLEVAIATVCPALTSSPSLGSQWHVSCRSCLNASWLDAFFGPELTPCNVRHTVADAKKASRQAASRHEATCQVICVLTAWHAHPEAPALEIA